MHHDSLLYSLDPKITLQQLKNQQYPSYDIASYTGLQAWVQENNIQSVRDMDSDIHYKFLAIRPKVHHFYYVGDIGLLNQKILGIVGPRKMSVYSKKVVETLFDSARAYNMVTISGMAEGIDQLCHNLSLDHNIPTIAVLWWWLGWYLRRKQEWAMIQKIVAAGGLVLSEYKLFDQPTVYTFPHRNRIVAWLSDVVFLPEAGKKSWSLITVDFALQMKKPVYATPNSIFADNSSGILEYIESWYVQPIFDLSKLLSMYFSSKNNISRPLFTISLTDKEQSLLSFLSHDQWLEIQDILQKTGGNLQENIQLLTMLEIQWLVAQSCPGKYILL